MEMAEKLDFIKTYDPEGAERLLRLLNRVDALKAGNVYGETFTDRQFSLVFDPLLEASFERAKILEALAKKENTIPGIAEQVGMRSDKVFSCIKDLMKKNQVEMAGHQERDAVFRRKQ
jgi:hypothetical protein